MDLWNPGKEKHKTKTSKISFGFVLVAIFLWIFEGTNYANPTSYRLPVPDSGWVSFYQELEDCFGVKGNFEKIQFNIVNGDDFACWEHSRCIGLWVIPHQIYFSDLALLSTRHVKHELAHDILGSTNRNNHDSQEFQSCISK
jgi:hypothetical protein